jgi:hypothetical protein
MIGICTFIKSQIIFGFWQLKCVKIVMYCNCDLARRAFVCFSWKLWVISSSHHSISNKSNYKSTFYYSNILQVYQLCKWKVNSQWVTEVPSSLLWKHALPYGRPDVTWAQCYSCINQTGLHNALFNINKFTTVFNNLKFTYFFFDYKLNLCAATLCTQWSLPQWFWISLPVSPKFASVVLKH